MHCLKEKNGTIFPGSLTKQKIDCKGRAEIKEKMLKIVYILSFLQSPSPSNLAVHSIGNQHCHYKIN